MDARIPQAAEDVLSAVIKPRIEDCFDTDPVVPRNAWLSALALACFWKAAHPPDDGQPVDEAFMEAVGLSDSSYMRGVKVFLLIRDGQLRVEAHGCEGPKCWEWSLWIGANYTVNDLTRSQLRALCRLLGIPLTSESTP